MVVFTYFSGMKFCLAFLLMVIFSFQVLPVKKMGKVLGKVQGTEQVQNDDTDDDDDSGNLALSYNDIILSSTSFEVSGGSCYLKNKISIIIAGAEVLPLVRLEKIPSPPPEC